MNLNNLLKSVVRCIPWPLLSRLLALRNVINAMPDPVLIYQMGKVGSSTVCKTFDDKEIPNLHVHFVSRDKWSSAAKLYMENGKSLPPHFHTGRLLRPWSNWTERRVKVVTLVRDPIAREVSKEFEMSSLLEVPTDDVNESLQVLRNRLTSPGALNFPYTWFENEILPTFGVDVFEHPFNRKEGFGRITRKNVDILILTLERLDDLVPTVLSDFVGQALQLKKDRVRTDKVYTAVKQRLNLEERTVRRLYDCEWMRHFYTDRDIEQFVERWSGARE